MPLALGCVKSVATSFSVQVNPSERGLVPLAQRYDPQERRGATPGCDFRRYAVPTAWLRLAVVGCRVSQQDRRIVTRTSAAMVPVKRKSFYGIFAARGRLVAQCKLSRKRTEKTPPSTRDPPLGK